jgi:hypothetical protein
MSLATAVHEAGHGVVALTRGLGVTGVSIVPTRHNKGSTRLAKSFGSYEVRDLLLITLAGAAGERKFTGRLSTQDVADRDQARLWAATVARADENAPETDRVLERYITIDQHGRIHEVDLSRATGYPFASKDELIDVIESMRPHLELFFWSIQQKKH